VSASQIVDSCFTTMVNASFDNIDIPMWGFSVRGRGTLSKFSGSPDRKGVRSSKPPDRTKVSSICRTRSAARSLPSAERYPLKSKPFQAFNQAEKVDHNCRK
jgi:hypothetical protein